jgi:hypothetical protein
MARPSRLKIISSSSKSKKCSVRAIRKRSFPSGTPRYFKLVVRVGSIRESRAVELVLDLVGVHSNGRWWMLLHRDILAAVWVNVGAIALKDTRLKMQERRQGEAPSLP